MQASCDIGHTLRVSCGKVVGASDLVQNLSKDQRRGRATILGKIRHSQKRKVKRSWCLVSCLSWLARLGFLSRARVSGSFFPVPACFLSVFSFSFCFFPLAAVVTFQLPDRRDVGSKARAPNQEPVQGADPRTGFFRYPSTRDCLAYLVAPVLFFVFLFAVLFLAQRAWKACNLSTSASEEHPVQVVWSIGVAQCIPRRFRLQELEE